MWRFLLLKNTIKCAGISENEISMIHHHLFGPVVAILPTRRRQARYKSILFLASAKLVKHG
jgi:hypothetical protein